ncbi:hypothetical protein OQJ40_21310 [Serratia nevei]|uniref:hypothetical protein n=1 Tax=Serratia nevei TaxID=2703794 RepID=UPI0027D3091D|nr:hypothetical protein [Serratia nevei]WMC74716.1 hypothetical protein O8I25_21065 [Serratia nevei]WMC80112.1 hypothetical protein O8I24_21300 [Serratia nevei]
MVVILPAIARPYSAFAVHNDFIITDPLSRLCAIGIFVRIKDELDGEAYENFVGSKIGNTWKRSAQPL